MGIRMRDRFKAMVGAAVLLAPVSAMAQSGVVMGADEELFHLLDNSGGIAVDFNVDDVNTTQQIVFGRADTAGFDEMNIDLVLIDNDSTLDNLDPSILLDSSDAAIRLGSGSAAEPGRDGDLFIEDGLGITTIQINGDSGNIDQEIDNSGSVTDFDGNGAIKAWAHISFSGDVVRCWNCNTDSADTQRIATGEYEVSFSVGNIDKRPVLATRACPQPGNPFDPFVQCTLIDGSIFVSPRLLDSQSFFVGIKNGDGEPQNGTFTIIVF